MLCRGKGARLQAEAAAEHHDEKQTVALHRQGAPRPGWSWQAMNWVKWGKI